jgi:hypothetical protein
VPTASQQRLQAMLSGTVVDASTVQQLLPGTLLPGIKVPQQPQQPDVQAQRKRQRAPPPPPEPPAGWRAERSAALLLEGGITLQVGSLVLLLWLHCGRECFIADQMRRPGLALGPAAGPGACQQQPHLLSVC